MGKKKERKPRLKSQKIAYMDLGDSWEKDYFHDRIKRTASVRFFEAPVHEAFKEIKDAQILSVFIDSKVTRSVIRSLKNLKLITTRSTGFDHIDLAAARRRGIVVTNVPIYGENTVAEHTFALILSLSRKLRKAYLRVVRNDFSIDGLMGFDLKDKTLGVIGTGHIGLHVIRMGTAFGMNVIAHDFREQKFLSEVLNFKYVTLNELLKQSDIITLHVPYLPSTRHLMNAKTMHMMKRGAILINTARGGLIDTDALLDALDKGILSGVGLDVLEGEEYILEEKRLLHGLAKKVKEPKTLTFLKNRDLLSHENVIYTPHMAFYSREAVQRILDTTLGNIRAFLTDKPTNIVK